MKSKPLGILILTFIVVAGISFFLIRPVVLSILSSWRNLSQTKENLKAIEEKKAVLEALKNNQNLTKVAGIAEKYIPKSQDSGQLVIELTAMAAENNLKTEQTSIEKSKDAAPAKEETETAATPKATPATQASATPAPATKTVDFKITVSGGFVDFTNFLKSIESNSRLIIIKNISIQTKTDAQTQAITFSIQLSGSAYYKSEVALDKTLDNIKISDEAMKRFLNLQVFGQPINLPSESGFGRTNPFEGY